MSRHRRQKPLLLLLAFLFAFLAIESATAEPAEPAEPWPTSYNAPAAAWSKGKLGEQHAYRSKSYLIICSEPLGRGRVDEMAKVAESVRGVLELFPLELLPLPDIAGESRPSVVRIFPTQAEYHAHGGPAGSVGYYNGRTREVIVSLQHLIEPKGHRSNLEPRQRYRLLVHELVHQAMGDLTGVFPLWFNEGLAEYLAATQFAPGRYRFDETHRQIISHFRTIWLHDRRNAITVPTVESLTQLTFRTWSMDNQMNKGDAYGKYAASLLLTHYQLELASRNLGGLREFVAQAKKEYEILKKSPWSRRRLTLDEEPLWRDRPFATIQSQLISYWRGKGLNISFKPLKSYDRRPAQPSVE